VKVFLIKIIFIYFSTALKFLFLAFSLLCTYLFMYYSFIIIIINGLRLQSQKRDSQRTTPCFLHWGSVGQLPKCQMTSGYMAVLYISIDRIPFLAPTLDIADRLFAQVITTGFYLHHVGWQIKTQLEAGWVLRTTISIN